MIDIANQLLTHHFPFARKANGIYVINKVVLWRADRKFLFRIPLDISLVRCAHS